MLYRAKHYIIWYGGDAYLPNFYDNGSSTT